MCNWSYCPCYLHFLFSTFINVPSAGRASPSKLQIELQPLLSAHSLINSYYNVSKVCLQYFRINSDYMISRKQICNRRVKTAVPVSLRQFFDHDPLCNCNLRWTYFRHGKLFLLGLCQNHRWHLCSSYMRFIHNYCSFHISLSNDF